MSYDQGYWHTDECSKQGLPEENAATHIAVYVLWCIKRNFLSDEIEQLDPEALRQVRGGQLSAAQYFENSMDWKFGEWCLNDAGNQFTLAYYDNYLADIYQYFPSIVYGKWSELDANSVTEFLDSKYLHFTQGKLRKKKPWWRFW